MPIRIYALAKELNFCSKTLVDVCLLAKIPGKGSALASLDDDEVHQLREFIRQTPDKLSQIDAENQRLERESRIRPPESVQSSGSNAVAAAPKPAAIPRPTAIPSLPIVDKSVATPSATANKNVVAGSYNTRLSQEKDVVDPTVEDWSVVGLINAVSSDMFKGFEHFAVVELGALFETILSRLDSEIDQSGLQDAIRRNCNNNNVSPALMDMLIAANRTRNRIVHRRPGRFPAASEILNAKRAFAIAIIDLHKRHRHQPNLIEPLADSNPEVLNVLDVFFGLDD